MDLNLALVKATCNGLSKNRASLFGFETAFGANVMKAAGSAAKNFMEGIRLLSKDSTNTPAEVWDIRKIPKETKFFQACHIVLESLDSIKTDHFSREELNLLMCQLTQKEVLISFYGDTSVGKSTLLNGIMENWYLPVEHGAETAVSVKIFFKKFDDENRDSWQNVDKLYKSGAVVAKGPLNIRKAIQVYNTKSRFKEEEVGGLELHLSTTFGQDVNQDPEIVLLDNPGCDENGSDIIISSIVKAKRSSAAFIFVTTFQQYRTMACSKALQNIFLQNPEIIKEKRLAVVINKMDQIFIRRPGHASYTKEKVIDEVHHFFCQKVFGCDEKQIAKDYIFLVCGTWAFYGRMYKKDRDEFEYGVENEILNVKYMKELYPLIKESVNRETPIETKANYLDKLSNIDELESRLKLMAASSFHLWKCKMTSDILNIMQDTVISIAEAINRETNCVEGYSADSGSDDIPSVSFQYFTSDNNKGEMSASDATEMKGIGLNLLDELSKQLKEHVRRNIISFVQNMNTNIVLVYCQTYYEAAISTLKEFDKSAAKDLITAETYLETNIRALEFHRESIKSLSKKLSAIRTMIEQFTLVSMEA